MIQARTIKGGDLSARAHRAGRRTVVWTNSASGWGWNFHDRSTGHHFPGRLEATLSKSIEDGIQHGLVVHIEIGDELIKVDDLDSVILVRGDWEM